MQKIRIQKIIASSGFCSRRKAEEIISQNRVKCNGRLVKLGDKADFSDHITIDGEAINFKTSEKFKCKYIILNKPRGYITTMSDERNRRCVADLVEDVGTRVYPVGRLDLNSEGLILLTNDGYFANKIMHPSSHITKTYRVTVRPSVDEEKLAVLAQGIYIEGKKTMPAVVRIISKEENRVVVEMKIKEGRKRQIRKMFDQIGLEVARLRRTAIGPIKLGMLKSGSWRELNPEEIRSIKNEIGV